MQALKDDKDALGLMGIEPNAIIPYGDHPFGPLALRGDMHARGRFATKLQRVANEVLQHQPELIFIRPDGWQGIAGDHGSALRYRHLQIQ
jgi:hypothetical protein